MTRINVGVDVKELPNDLLFTEYREITRIPNAILSGKAIISDIPTNFRLGEGHVKFFYNKLTYLYSRWKQLRDECRSRGINITDTESSFKALNKPEYQHLWFDYLPTARDREIILRRFAEKGHILRKI